MLKGFIPLLLIFICSLSSAMAEENYKFSCHGWKGTLIHILPGEIEYNKNAVSPTYEVAMRPINLDFKYKENDLSFVWPKNADWSDEKVVPIKAYVNGELVTTLNGVKHKEEHFILASLFVHRAVITYTLHPGIDKATINTVHSVSKYPKIKVVYSQNLTADCDLSGESEKDNRNMPDPIPSSVFAKKGHGYPLDPIENHKLDNQIGPFVYSWDGSPFESEMENLLGRVADRVKKRYWQRYWQDQDKRFKDSKEDMVADK